MAEILNFNESDIYVLDTFRLTLLLTRLDSAYSVMWGAHQIWGNVLAVL